MKAYTCVAVDSCLVQSFIGTAPNVSNVTKGHYILYDQGSVVFADASYQGVHKYPEATGVLWQVAMRQAKRRALVGTCWGVLIEQAEKHKARSRSLAKNTVKLVILFSLSTLCMVRK